VTAPFKVFIPARYASSRLPGKPLLRIGDKSLIHHVHDAAALSQAQDVAVVTDDDRIRTEVESFGGAVIMTAAGHESGTERIMEAIDNAGEDDDTVIVNVQGDEYGLSPRLIDQVGGMLARDAGAAVATLCEKITDTVTFNDPNVVKVVVDRSRHALYFSRAPIPTQPPGRTGAGGDFGLQPWRHVGIYAYRAGFLRTYAGLPACALERSERLEQLRMLYYGHPVLVEEACAGGSIGVDTESDLQRARKAVISNKS